MKQYVAVKKDERFVICPFCSQKIDLENIEGTACIHLDNEDYITPRPDGYDVWFTEEMTFAEFISRCDVSHWETINSNPDPIIQKGDYAIVEVVPADDPDFRIKEIGEKIIVDWGEPVILLDNPYQSAYTIYRRIEEGHWKCLGSLYATLNEAKEVFQGLLV